MYAQNLRWISVVFYLIFRSEYLPFFLSKFFIDIKPFLQKSPIFKILGTKYKICVFILVVCINWHFSY